MEKFQKYILAGILTCFMTLAVVSTPGWSAPPDRASKEGPKQEDSVRQQIREIRIQKKQKRLENEQKIREDNAKLKQDLKNYTQQLDALRAQRKAAYKAKNNDQANILIQQIEKFKNEQHLLLEADREKLRADREEMKKNREFFKKALQTLQNQPSSSGKQETPKKETKS